MSSEKGKVHYIRNNAGITVTVDNTANEVGLILTGTPAIVQEAALPYFAAKDNVMIESITFDFPYQFGQGSLSNPLQIQLYWNDPIAATSGVVPDFGQNGLLFVPDCNVEYPVGAFFEWPALATTKFNFEIRGLFGNVNMINAPASLNLAVLDAAIYLKVRHTLVMIG